MKTTMIEVDITSRSWIYDAQIQKVFETRLNDLTEIDGRKSDDLCLRDGKIYDYDEHYHNGAEMLTFIANEDDPRYMVQVAALKLQAALDTQKRIRLAEEQSEGRVRR